MTNRKLNKTFGGKKQLGQGMTEYIIIVALIAVAAIGVYSAFGHTLNGALGSITGAVGGQTGDMTNGLAKAKEGADNANAAANQTVGMDTYTKNVKDQ
jgi:Flp pilus assembly pilin Flp